MYTTVTKSWHIEIIHRVEERLLDSLKGKCPSLKTLVGEFAMSESTLKRHFKAVYGKTIYDYYLEKKMEFGKRLITEKQLSVKETACTLGYKKVDNFIHAFKKYEMVTPGSFKKKV